MRTASFTLSLPPSVNGLYATTAEGRRVKTKAHRDWSGKACNDIRLQAIEQRMQPFAGTFKVSIWASDQGLTHARDCDNLAKAAIDAFVKAAFIPADNHRHLRAVSIEWDSTLSEGTCSVSIVELTSEPLAAETKRPATHIAEKNKASVASSMALLRAIGINVASHRIHFQ